MNSALEALLVLSLTLAACGGGEPPLVAPPANARHSDSSAPARGDSRADDAPAEEEAPQAGPCDDGTCSSCGAGICPAGWYCDESAKGGPACGWLPACAAARGTSCACVTGKLGSGCACSEQSGGLHVTCK